MSELTQAQLKKVLHYCPDTGIFTWLQRGRDTFKSDRGFRRFNSTVAGKMAGHVTKRRGYCEIGIAYAGAKCKLYKAHRLAWLYIKGEWPNLIDHINGDKIDNRIINLRDTDVSGNLKNAKTYITSKTGVPGVRWRSDVNKWHAVISINRKTKHLGYFESLFDAICARKSAEIKNGYHPNHGRR